MRDPPPLNSLTLYYLSIGLQLLQFPSADRRKTETCEPTSIIAQVDGSGTPPGGGATPFTTPSLRRML
jgi:hypothetical protein